MLNKICLFIQSPACGQSGAYVYVNLSAVFKIKKNCLVEAIFPVLPKTEPVIIARGPREKLTECSAEIEIDLKSCANFPLDLNIFAFYSTQWDATARKKVSFRIETQKNMKKSFFFVFPPETK